MLNTQVSLFLFGVSDSLQLHKAISYYTGDQCNESKAIERTIYESLKFSISQLTYLYLIDLGIKMMGYLYIPSWVEYLVYPIVLLFFIENQVRQLVYIQQITQNAIKFETNVKESRQYLIRELKKEEKIFKSLVDQLKLTVQALLFSMILLVQTSVLDVLVVLLPQDTIMTYVVTHIDYLCYAVYITVGYTSLKIPYKDHFPYYLHIHFAYLVGYSVVLSYILNVFFTFPKLSVVFSILSPLFMLRSFQVDPPLIKIIQSQTFKQNLLSIWHDFIGVQSFDRSSYEHHLKEMNSDTNKRYRYNSKRIIGWFTLARGLRPYVIQPIGAIFQTFMSLYYSIM